MYPNPTLYNRANFVQLRDGAKMIERIKSELGSKPIDTILDIGCGSGNLTEMMFRELKPKRIIAFDLAANMVAFARQNTTARGAILYYQADACAKFETISARLQLEASSVDVVTSFYCIYWVPDKSQTCKNIFKFLKPNGKFYLIISVWHDLLPIQRQIIDHKFWRPILISKMKECMSIPDDIELVESALANFLVESKPNHDSLQKFWQNYCLNAALVMEDMSFIYADYPFKKVQHFNDQVEAVCYWLKYIPAEQHNRFLADYFFLIKCTYVWHQICTQKSRRRSLNILEPSETLAADIGLLAKMTTEQEAFTLFRFNYIYATVVGRKPSTAV